MSRGRGRIQRQIMRALRSDPQNAFTCDELCKRIYGVDPEPRHRSSMLRAMQALAAAEATVAPLTTKRSVGAAIYSSGSVAGGNVARAKLSFLNAQRFRRYAKPLDMDDEAWLMWSQARNWLLRFQPDRLSIDEKGRRRLENVQREYGLAFGDAWALIACFGLVAEQRGGKPKQL